MENDVSMPTMTSRMPTANRGWTRGCRSSSGLSNANCRQANRASSTAPTASAAREGARSRVTSPKPYRNAANPSGPSITLSASMGTRFVEGPPWMRKKPTASSATDMASDTTNMARQPNCVSANPEAVGLMARPTAMTPLFSARRVPRTAAGEFVMMTLVTDGKNRPVPTACTRRLANSIGKSCESSAHALPSASAPAPTKNTRLSPRRLSMNADSMMAVAATTMYPTITQFAMESVTPKRSASSGRATFIMLWPNEAVNEHASSTGSMLATLPLRFFALPIRPPFLVRFLVAPDAARRRTLQV